MLFNNKAIFIWGSILWTLVIFILCTLPGENIPDPHLDIPHIDKIVHFGMFFIFSILLTHLLKLESSFCLRLIYAIVIFSAFVYGGSIELLQHYFFNRSGDVYDLSADMAGAIAGCFCYPFFIRFLTRRRERKAR